MMCVTKNQEGPKLRSFHESTYPLHFLISMASAMSWRYSAWSASTASIPPCAILQRLRHVRRAAAANALRVEDTLAMVRAG